MKIVCLAMLMIQIFYFSCSTQLSDKNNNDFVESIEGQWSISNIRGGLLGIDVDYEYDIITLNFVDEEQILYVENNDTIDVDYLGLVTGSYSYSILEVNGNQFLLIDSNELGKINVNDDMLFINQDELSNGVLNGGYNFTFIR